MPTAAEYEVLNALQVRLAQSGRGAAERLYADAARALGCSVATLYRKRAAAGLSDVARKRRHDAGRTQLTDDELRTVSGVLAASMNERGQRLPVRDALDMLRASGQLGPLAAETHESTVMRQLYARRLHPEQLALPRPSVQVAARHPNHVWQIDSTTGAYYYLPGGKLRWMAEDEFYKNKVANLVRASSDLLTRYSVVDVASHAGKTRHYLGGESAENLIDFTTWAMVQQPGNPMHGVPAMLVMDPGAANKGALMRTLCRNVGVRLIHHAPGNARATGSVEKWHDLVGMHFEKRLRFVDPSEVTLERLNEWVEAWVADFCTTRTHSRHGKPRFMVWQAILETELRKVASLEVLRGLANREPETRRVDNDRCVSFEGRTYELALVPGAIAGLKVTLQVNVFRHPAIDVQFCCPDTGEVTWHVVEPAQTDELGYRVGSPVWGEGHPRVAANSELDDNRNALLKDAYALPTIKEAERARRAHAQAYAGVVQAFGDIGSTPAPSWLPRKGSVVELPQRQVQARALSVVEMCKRLRDRLGALYGPQVFTELAARFAEAGVPEDMEEALVAQYMRPAAVAAGGQEQGQTQQQIGGAA